jgi:hypothetical protein
VLQSPPFEKAFLDITESVFAFITLHLWEEVFRPLEHSECDFPPPVLMPAERTSNPGSPNTPVDLESPDSSPGDKTAVSLKGQERKVGKPSRMVEHKFRDASIPLAKLLPKIKAVAFKYVI